ncbi:hypothetical protein M9H77_30403 [Catharanthus roseus]|uniref:Uncharacterized protein n=1 Tax=Catharanthus roseus TaxID=4058 RepID=A0ACB9ZXI3_CATRO|nr:hypothetical protein M9H77_30403 [Catharanthus roseus]
MRLLFEKEFNHEKMLVLSCVDMENMNCDVLNPFVCENSVLVLSELEEGGVSPVMEISNEVSLRHFMRSQRGMTKNNIAYLQELNVRELRGSPFVGFTLRDAYNSLRLNNLEDAHRKENEDNFYFNFEIDCFLSSQRSEITNHTISRRLSKTTTFYDFYRIFDEVVPEWRSNANMEDFCFNQGHVEMMVSGSKLLQHTNRLYTIGGI